MSGKGTRYQKAGYTDPKPLIAVNGIPMIERLLESFPKEWPVTFILAEDHKNTELPKLLENLRPEGKQFFTATQVKGPSHAVAEFSAQIDDRLPVLISYCDYGMKWNAKEFQKFVKTSNCDACVVSYLGFHAHYLSPVTYAYSRMQGERVVEIKEKGSFTENRENEFASCGAYYFKSLGLFNQAYEFQQKNNLQLNDEYYTSLTVEALLRLNPKSEVRIFEIERFYQWGTPADLQDYEYWEQTFAHRSEEKPEQMPDQLLIPMAGLGSRLAELNKIPKPLVMSAGKSMYRRAVESLPKASKTVFVTREQIANKMKLEKFEQIIALDYIPAGQALTTELGVKALDQRKPVWVTACDHSFFFDEHQWKNLVKNLNPDAVVFTIKNFPGVYRKPMSFSYVKADEKNNFQGISVKKPISENPRQDHLLVGTFWFKSAEILQQGISSLKEENSAVNGELYLDGIFDHLLKLNLRIHIFELSGYINWGDIESFKEATYWYETFISEQNAF